MVEVGQTLQKPQTNQDEEMSNTLHAERPSAKRRTYQSAAREEQKRESRSRILECALRRFNRHGFDGTSLRDVASDAGVTHALVRAHFGSKEDLWRAAMAFMFEKQEGIVDFRSYSRIERLSAEDVRRFVHQFALHAAFYTDDMLALFREGIGELNDRMKWLIDNHVEPVTRPIVRLLERAMDEGIVVAMPVHTLVLVIASLSQTAFLFKEQTELCNDKFGSRVTTNEMAGFHGSKRKR